MRATVSKIGTQPYGISKYFVDIIQPTINKNQHKLKNSKSFVLLTWRIKSDEIQILYVTNLDPSTSIDKAIDVILRQLSDNYDDLKHSAAHGTLCKIMLFSLGQCYLEFT